MVSSPSSSENHKKMKSSPSTTATPSPLRRSERQRNISSNLNHSPSTSRTSVSKSEAKDEKTSSSQKTKNKMDARRYRNILTQKKNKDCDKETNDEHKLTPKDSNKGEGKIDECFNGISLQCKEVFEDCIKPSKDAKSKDMSAKSMSRGLVEEPLENNVIIGSTVVASNSTTQQTSEIPEKVHSGSHEEETRGSDSNGSLIRKCVGNDTGGNLTPSKRKSSVVDNENLTPSKRKSTVVDKESDVSHALGDDINCSLAMDVDPERLHINSLETSGPSKRIRGINNVDQPTLKSNDEKSSTRNKEERSQGNNVETEKIRKQQRSLHLSLKPEIAKLWEILLLPDNVKGMVGKFLEYTMNNYLICTEPVSILHAFQLSLCLTAASLLSHKLDSEAALNLAKRHLNFSCKKDAVDEISAMLWNLKDNFLLLTGNSNANCSPKVSESSKRVHSNIDTTSDVELTKKDISKISRNIKVNQNRKAQWKKLRHIQQENKRKLVEDIQNEISDLKKMFDLEWQATLPFFGKEKEKLREFKSKYNIRETMLKREQEARLQALEAKQFEARQKFRESSAPDELSNIVPSKELGTSHNAPKILLSNQVSETSCKRATASELSRKEAVGLPSRVRSTDSPENGAPLNSLSIDQISDEGLDGVVSPRPRSSFGPSYGHPATVSLLNSPSSIQKVPGRVSPAITDGQIPVTGPELSRDAADGLPSTVRSTGYPENAAALNSSPTDQISDVGLDGVVSSTPCMFSSPSDGLPATSSLLNSPSSKQQVPDRVLSPITDGQIPTVVPENNHEEAKCQLTDNVEMNESTTSNYQEGVDRTMAENTLSQETSVSRTVDPIEPQKQVHGQPLSSVEPPPSPVHILPGYQPTQVSMVMEPPEQGQQLPLSGFLSSNQDISNLPSAAGGEDQAATNRDSLSSQIPDASAEVQNQAAEQPALNLEVGSHSHQAVPPVSDMVLDSLVPGGVRAQSLDTRNLSTHRVINNHPIQTPAQSASRNFPPLFYDSLSYELERIRKSIKQNLKNHEDMKLQLKCNFEKEIEELRRKYDTQMKEIEVEFQKTSKNYDTQFKTVYVHKILADTMKANSDPRFSGESGMLQGLTQLPRPQNPTHPSIVAGPSCQGPHATTFQNSHGSTGSHSMLPSSIHASYNTPGNISGFSARPPHINISSPNLQAGGEICAPPLHPPPYRSSTSVPASGLMGEFRAPPSPLQPYRPSTSVPASSHSGEIRAPPPPIPPYRPTTSVPASSNSAAMRTPPPPLLPYRPSTSVPVSRHSGAMRTPPPPLPPYRPSTSVPASSNSGAMRTPPPPIPPYRPSTSLPTSSHSGAIRTPAPHLPPYRPSTSVPTSSLSGEIRVPAPHIPPYRPSTSVPASSLGGIPHGMPSNPAPSNAPASSLLSSQRLPSPMPAISQFGPHRGHGNESTGGFPTPNVSATDMRMNANNQSTINLPNTLPHMSDSASLNHSQFSKRSGIPANSTQEATHSDVVCLSDDD